MVNMLSTCRNTFTKHEIQCCSRFNVIRNSLFFYDLLKIFEFPSFFLRISNLHYPSHLQKYILHKRVTLEIPNPSKRLSIKATQDELNNTVLRSRDSLVLYMRKSSDLSGHKSEGPARFRLVYM